MTFEDEQNLRKRLVILLRTQTLLTAMVHLELTLETVIFLLNQEPRKETAHA